MSRRRAQYDFRDCYQTLTLEQGAIGSSIRIRSGDKVTIDPGSKATGIKSFLEVPIFITRGTAEPKFTLDGMLERDVSNVREFVGGIGGFSFRWTGTFRRPGQAARIFMVTGMQISGGMGLAMGDDGVKDKLECLCLDVFEDNGNGPVSIYAKRHAT